jgi:hypothetical protein
VECAQFQFGVYDAINETVQARCTPDDILAQVIGHWDAITANLKVHLLAPF